MAEVTEALRDEGFYEFKKTCKSGTCWVKGCRNAAKTENHSMCAKHEMRRWRSLNKEKGAYATLRDHAKARKVKFTISYEFFRGLTEAYCFWDQDPKEKSDVLTIDRRDATKGYEPGNLRIVSLSENVIKGNKERYLPEHVQDMLRRQREKALEEERQSTEDECPF